MEDVRLGDLKKYVPYMDYIVTLDDYKYKDKFKLMRQWIIDNKKLSKEYFEKLEKSIIVTYKELGKSENFPCDLHKIFTVDLCSDDEDDDEDAAPVKQVAGSNPVNSDPKKHDSDNNPKIPVPAENNSKNSAPVTQIAENHLKSQVSAEQLAENNSKNSAPATQIAENHLKSQVSAEELAENNSKNSAPAGQVVENHLKSQVSAKQLAENNSKNSAPAAQVVDTNLNCPVSTEQVAENNSKNLTPEKSVSDNNSNNTTSAKEVAESNLKDSAPTKQVAKIICDSQNLTEAVTISDNENDDVEIVTASFPNLIHNTLPKPFNYVESLKKRGNNLLPQIDPNDEIFERINATNISPEIPRFSTTDKPAEVYNVAGDNDEMYFRRRNDFNGNFRKGNVRNGNNYNLNDLMNAYADQRQNKAIKTKSKKKKKKHKKEKRHRREGRKEVPQYKIVDNITIDSEDDEDLITDGTQNLQISNLNEPELLNIKRKIMAEIETENCLDPKDKQSGIAGTDLTNNAQVNEVDELEQLKNMKDNIMKQMGLDKTTTALLEELILGDLQNKSSEQIGSRRSNQSPIRDQISVEKTSNSLPILDSTTMNTPSQSISVLEHSTLERSVYTSIDSRDSNPNSNIFHPIPLHQYPPELQNRFLASHLNNQFTRSNQYMPNMTTPVRYNNPPLPVPPPINAPLAFTPSSQASMSASSQNQHFLNGFSMQPLPTQSHSRPTEATSYNVPNTSTQFHSFIQPLPTQSYSLPTEGTSYNVPNTSTQFHSSNIYPMRNLPTQGSASNLIPIPLSKTPIPAPTQTYPLSSNFTLNRPPHPNQLLTQTAPTHHNSSNDSTLTTQSTFAATKSQLALKDPRVRKMIEEGQYGHKRQSPTATTQAQNPTVPLCPPAVTTIHNWIRPTSSKDGTTKSATTYGEHVREMNKKRQSDEENARRKQEKQLLEKQRKLEEKLRLERVAKEVEDIEFQKQTENIKQILNPHKDDIMNILQNLASKENNATVDNSKSLRSPTDINLKDNSVKKTLDPKKNCTQQNRELKELECTVNGFNKMQDFLLSNSDGKRRSSISARKAIASLLIPPLESESQNPNKNIFDTPTSEISKKRRSLSVSSDTEICQPKRQKNNITQPKIYLPKIKPCRVVLHRMSQLEISKHTQKRINIDATATKKYPKRILEMSLPRPSNEAKQKDKIYATKSVSAPIEVKNIDCQMTERNCDTCVLCQKHSSNLTNHFIRIHKKESYLSRLTWEELDDLQINVPFAEEVISHKNKAISAKSGVKHFKVECPFCPEGRRVVVGTFENLRRHYSTHTGEYAYQCKSCGLQKPYRKEILSHQDRTKCVDGGLQTLYLYPSNLMVIYIYACHICNFVQLNEENVFKHLREQHGKLHKDHKYVKEYTLAAIKDGPIERVRLVTLPEIIPTADNYMENAFSDKDDSENVVVGNEPLLDDTLSNIIKPEPLDDEAEFLWDNPTKQTSTPTLQATFNTASTSANINTVACLETSDVDIKPEMETFEENLFEDLEAYFASTPLVESTALQEPTPVLENKPDVEKLTLEAVKAILRKYSANAGIRPDLLYQCSEPDCRGFFSNFKLWSSHMITRHYAVITKCPHCLSRRGAGAHLELPIADFEQHFKTHCLALYLCYHCDIRCVDEQQLRDHAQQTHADIAEVRIERIPFNFTYSYHVLVGKDTLPERLEFLIKLCNVLRERVERMEAQAEDSEFVISQWTASNAEKWLDELSIPVYLSTATNPKCIFPSCKMSFTNPISILDHLKTQHDSRKDYLFSCRLCGITSSSKTPVALVKHNFMHADNIFVCGVCSYMDYDRKSLSKHICSDHDQRDVPVLTLRRSKTDVKFQIEFIFAAGSRTFTTTNRCFCGCGANNLRIDTYVSHLRREHLLKLYYFCEYCDERLPQLKLSDEHFRMKHPETGVVSKVRCKLACSNDRQVKIISNKPLEIRLSDESYGSFESDTESPKKGVIPNAVIKKEIDEDDAIIIMEEDEIIAEKEAKEASRLKNSARPGISCTSILNLM